MRSLLTRAAVVGVTAWFAATGVTGTVAWRAVAVLNAGGESTGVLSGAEVRTALSNAQARAANATPRPVQYPLPTITATPTEGTEVARTWVVPGGTVAAVCTGGVIGLDYTTAEDGWTVEVYSSGPTGIEVELHQGEQEVVVRAQCVDGEPVPQIDDTHDTRADTQPAPPPAQAPAPVPAPRRTTTSATPSPSPSDSESHHDGDEHASPSPSPTSEPRR